MELKKTEKLEHSVVALTIEITAQEMETAKDKAFKKAGKNIAVPGFRKGKAPRKMVEKLYGEGVFFEDAVNIIYPEAMDMAVEQAKISAVGRADVELGDIPEQGGITLIVKVPVEPEVKLSTYKGIEAEKETVKISASDVKAELTRLAQRSARIETVDRKAKNGDGVEIDFEGFIDGVAFEGGKGENHKLELGSNSFIPGFEEQLIGCAAGEDKDVAVTFPTEYHAKELAGKQATFKCHVHKVEQTVLPEMDDEFAKDVSETCDTLDALKEEIEGRLKDERQKTADHDFEEKVLDGVLNNMEADVPEVMYETQIDSIVQDFGYRMQSQGIALEQYLQMNNMDMETFRGMFRDQAVRQVKGHLALQKIAELEDIAISDKEIEDEYAKMAEQYHMELDKIKQMINEDALRDDLKIGRAHKLITETAKAKKKTATKKKAIEVDSADDIIGAQE